MSVFRNLIKINKIYQSRSLKLTQCCLSQCAKKNNTLNGQTYIIKRSFNTSAALLNQTNPGTDSSSLGLEHVYTGSLSEKMKAVKIFSLATSVAGLAIQPVLIEQGAILGGTPMVVFLCTFAGFFTFITPALLHFVTKKYVTQMHYNRTNDEYIATTISFFLQKKLVCFSNFLILLFCFPYFCSFSLFCLHR